MPVLALLPAVGVHVLRRGRSVPPASDDLLAEGEEVYSGRASACHGATGDGGTGPQLSDGEVLLTFPDPKAMMQWIHLGADDWPAARRRAATATPTAPGGPHNAGELRRR